MARRALLLANGAFDGEGIGHLQSPLSDARQLAALLVRQDVGQFDVEVHCDKPTHDLRLAISKFFKASRPGDHQIVHISGHGFKDEHGKLYFGARDTDVELLDVTAVSARFLHERATESLASQTIIFIDTCFSGAYLNGQMKAGVNVIAKDDFIVDGSNGVAIITASSSTQLGWEVESGNAHQSVFTKYLIEGICSGAADVAASGKIALDNLFQYISDNVRQEVPGQQPKPFYFGLSPNVTVTLNPSKPMRVLPADLLAKIESSDFMRRCDGCRDLHDLVARDSDWANIAMVHLASLAADPDDRVRRRATLELEGVHGLIAPNLAPTGPTGPVPPAGPPKPTGTIDENRPPLPPRAPNNGHNQRNKQGDLSLGLSIAAIAVLLIIVFTIMISANNRSGSNRATQDSGAAADANAAAGNAMAADAMAADAMMPAEGAMAEEAAPAEAAGQAMNGSAGAMIQGSMNDAAPAAEDPMTMRK